MKLNDEKLKKIGANIERRRKSLGWTHVDLSSKTNFTEPFIKAVEDGNFKNLTKEMLEKFFTTLTGSLALRTSMGALVDFFTQEHPVALQDSLPKSAHSYLPTPGADCNGRCYECNNYPYRFRCWPQ